MTSLIEREIDGRRETNALVQRISPAIPVPPSACDAEAIRRFPRGYPHIVALADERGATTYAVRLRTISGRLEVIGETTPLLSEAQDGLRSLHGDLLDAINYKLTQETEDAAENAFLVDWWPNGIEAVPDIDAKDAPFGWPRVHYPDLEESFLDYIPNYFPIVLSLDRKGRRYYTNAYKDSVGYLCWPDPWSDEPRNCLHGIEHAAILRVAQWQKINSIPYSAPRLFR
jgi:hypothetical protein